MPMHPLAGKPAPPEILVDLPKLITTFYSDAPDPREPSHRVVFGTSGHRGSSLTRSFNEAHILAITQAICDYRASLEVTGPLFLGKDTHGLSEPAWATAVSVLAANGVELCVDAAHGYTPTPVISHAIVSYNRGRKAGLADGIVITPSHNPPEDGGIKYNPPHGGPAESEATGWIADRANALLESGVARIRGLGLRDALAARTTHAHDFVGPYVAALADAIDMEAIASAGLRIGADPMGGSGVAYFDPIAERYGLSLTVVHPHVDATFRFMRVDKDGKIRMDCSSRSAMAGLVELKDEFDIAFGNDADFDRHGIVTPSRGLLDPNHYLAVCIDYLFRRREGWRKDAAVGKTLVSSSLIDRVAAALGRPLAEVPVGFKWFVAGLSDGSYGFGGEESAGASFLRRDGTVWTTDKDGILLDLLAAEITATTGEDPGRYYERLVAEHGEPVYRRIDAPASPAQKAALGKLSPRDVDARELAGDPITAKLTHAPANQAAIGGIKVTTAQGWFAARPSGTEDVYKIYAESFRGTAHLDQIIEQATEIVSRALRSAGVV